MTTGRSIIAEIDFSQDGKQMGYLRLPHSVHRSAYGWLPIPVASVKNGSGPKVVLMAGNHGDEYEGQVILSRLIADLEPEMVGGQVIVLPMSNFPAARAGRRTSPIDEGNLNRTFPGDPNGTVTQIIADYIENVVMEGVDLVVDLHSGGSSLLYHEACMLVSAGAGPADDPDFKSLLSAFGLTYALYIDGAATTGGFSSSAACRQGGSAITTELGGGGTVQPRLLAMADQGLKHMLGAFGALTGPLVPDAAPGAPTFQPVDPHSHYVYANEPGIFEPAAELGDRVAAGQTAGWIHFVDTPGRAPAELRFAAAGITVCKRQPAMCQRGDCLWHLAEKS